MASFEELWRDSAKFRNIFVGDKKFYASMSRFDLDEAKELWEERWPYLDWNFCKAEGCKGLVGTSGHWRANDKYCSEHISKNGKMPKYVWYGNDLYKFLSMKVHGTAKHRKKEYIRLSRLLAIEKYGKFKGGYKIMFADGNYLNYSMENIIVVTKVSAAAIDAGVLSVADSVEVDNLIEDFVIRRFGGGRKPFRHSYDHEDIAMAADVKGSAVRKAISEGRLDPYDLASVLQFVNNCKKNDNLSRSA